MGTQTFEIIISELDFYLIQKVRELRISHKPYLSQLQLSLQLGFSESAVARIENLQLRDRYNIRAVNRIIKFFKLKSYAKLFPENILEHDLVRIRLEKPMRKKGKIVVHADGSIDTAYKVLSITPLTEAETFLWQAKKLPYLTIVK